MKIQIETLVVKQREGEIVALKSNTEFNVEIAKPPIFDRNTSKVVGFVIACKLYINMRMRIRKVSVKEQIQ